MGERWTEHEENTHLDIGYAWGRYGEDRPIEAGLLILQSIARSLAVLADEAEERRHEQWVK